jgi:putative NIF3 family GTP cyclohydrolase 1 type 2
MGRVGTLAPCPVRALIDRLKAALAIEHVLVAGPIEREVSSAAVCAGSGGEFLDDAVRAGAQLFLTGEVRHHDALRGSAAGLTLICALHSASERAALVPLERRLAERLPGVVITRSRVDREPFSIA